MTQEEIIKKNAEGCAEIFGAYRKLEFLNDWIAEVVDYMERESDFGSKAIYCKTLIDLKTQRQELIDQYGIKCF